MNAGGMAKAGILVPKLVCLAAVWLFVSLSPAHAQGDSACPDSGRMQIVESGLNLSEMMRKHQIPGMSVAVIENYKIVCSRGYGNTQRGGNRLVTPKTLFMAGSISKPVAAVGALYLVQQNKLTLEDDVNLSLKSWKVAANEFTARHRVTLGLLLDHTGGFTGGDFFPGYASGMPVPTLVQVLDGRPPATNEPIRVGYVPGTKWQYSGDGYLVIQQLIIDVSGEPFPNFMRRVVFDKVGMPDSTYEEPLPPRRATEAASGTTMDGSAVNGGWHVTPEMAAGGLWSTPTDLAKLAIEIALSKHGKANHVLSTLLTQDMLRVHWKEGVVNILGTPDERDAMGYGFFVGQRNGRFGHIGGNVGYQATLVMFADTGNGAAIMTDSDIGLAAGNALLNRIAEVYRWNYTAPPPP